MVYLRTNSLVPALREVDASLVRRVVSEDRGFYTPLGNYVSMFVHIKPKRYLKYFSSGSKGSIGFGAWGDDSGFILWGTAMEVSVTKP